MTYRFSCQKMDEDQKYYVGVSAGVDSIVLCDWLFRKRLNLEIVHVNHHLTDHNNAMVEKVLEFGHSRNIPVKVFVGKPYDGSSSPEIFAREIRINVWKQIKGNLIVAHHFDDVIETHMLNFFNGKEDHMPIPLKTQFNDCLVMRPNLLTRKATMLAYAENSGLNKYIYEDPTNKCDNHGDRNCDSTMAFQII